MSAFMEFVGAVLQNIGLVFIWLMCAVGVLLSCLSISGTWLVVAASLVAFVIRGSGFPGLGTLLFFVYVSILVEVAEYVAGFWGIKQRGGSDGAGWAALVGGFAGLFVGSVIPIPVVGSIIGMVAGSFGLVYVVEKRRLRQDAPALRIAFGAVVSRALVVLLKVSMTLGMIAWLAIGMSRWR